MNSSSLLIATLSVVSLGVGALLYNTTGKDRKEKKEKKEKKDKKEKWNKEKTGKGKEKEKEKGKKQKEEKTTKTGEEEKEHPFPSLSNTQKIDYLNSKLSKVLPRFISQLQGFKNSITEIRESKTGGDTLESLLKKVPQVLSPIDYHLIEFIHSLDKQSVELRNKLSLVTKLAIVIFVTFYHSARFLEEKKDEVGEWREDLTIALNLLKEENKNLKSFTFDEQYAYVIFICWLAQRVQNGTIIIELLDAAVPLLLNPIKAEMDLMCVPQLVCAAAVVNRWDDAHNLSVLLKRLRPEIFFERCDDYHMFAKSQPRLYLDFKQIVELAEIEHLLMTNSAKENQTSFAKYNWQHFFIRSGRIKPIKDEEWTELEVENTESKHRVFKTGLIARMLNIGEVPIILSGPVTDEHMDLSGYEYLKMRYKEGDDLESFNVIHRENLRLNHNPRGDHGVLKNIWSGNYVITVEKLKTKVDLDTTNETPTADNDLVAEDGIKIEEITSQNSTPIAEEEKVEESTKEIKVEETKAEGSSEEHVTSVEPTVSTPESTIAPTEPTGESRDPELDMLLQLLKSKLEGKKELMSESEYDIEIEFSPFSNIVEFPKEIYFLFGDDLTRFCNLVDSISK